MEMLRALNCLSNMNDVFLNKLDTTIFIVENVSVNLKIKYYIYWRYFLQKNRIFGKFIYFQLLDFI